MTYPRIIAHRCGGALAPENTLAGLEAAARLGCRAVEFDVMLTTDGMPILMHDETLDRTTRCTGRVAECSFIELRDGDSAIPTLDEAITACHRLGLWANIELKPSAGREEETGTVVGRWLARHWNGWGVISSFSEKSALAGWHELRHAPFALLYEALPADWQEARARLGAVAVHLDAAQLDRAVAEALAGLPWACYTVNDRIAADCLFASGCSAVFTDRPDLWLSVEMLSEK